MRPFHPKLITESALRAVVKEEIANQLLIEELNLLSEYKLRNFALDVAGLFPGAGEGADVINAIDLAKQAGFNKNIPVFAPALADQPVGEWAVGLQFHQVRGNFFKVGFEFTAPQATTFRRPVVKFKA